MTAVRLAWVLALLPIWAALPTQAAQPLVTDDAAVLAPKTCQLELWAHSTRDGREYLAQPACNLTDSLELAIGGARVHPDAGEPSSIVQLQAKIVLLPRTETAISIWAPPTSMARERTRSRARPSSTP